MLFLLSVIDWVRVLLSKQMHFLFENFYLYVVSWRYLSRHRAAECGRLWLPGIMAPDTHTHNYQSTDWWPVTFKIRWSFSEMASNRKKSEPKTFFCISSVIQINFPFTQNHFWFEAINSKRGKFFCNIFWKIRPWFYLFLIKKIIIKRNSCRLRFFRWFLE